MCTVHCVSHRFESSQYMGLARKIDNYGFVFRVRVSSWVSYFRYFRAFPLLTSRVSLFVCGFLLSVAFKREMSP